MVTARGAPRREATAPTVILLASKMTVRAILPSVFAICGNKE